MKEQSLMISTLILTATSFLSRIIGMTSIIFLSHILGSEGIGIYELIMSVYMTAVAFASAGLSVSVSKLVAEELGTKQYMNVTSFMNVALFFALSLSSLICALLYISAPFLAQHFVHDPHATTALRLLAFSIPFISCSSCFKGYFYATKKTVYPAGADILEQFVKLGLIIILVRICSPKGLSYAYGAIGFGLTIGEITSWTYLGTLYLIERQKACSQVPNSSKNKGKLLLRFLNVLVPLALIAYIAYIFMCIENILIPSGFKKHGNSFEETMSMYGIIKGMVIPILFFPSAFLTAFSTTLVPEIARANIMSLKERVTTTTNRVLQLTFILSTLVVGILFNYSDELGYAIYKSAEIGPILRKLAIIVPFIYIEVVTDGILKGLGKQIYCMKYSIIDAILRIILIYFLIPYKGLSAFIGIMIISSIFTSTLTFNTLLSTTKIKFQLFNWLIKPTLAAAAGGTFSRLLINTFFRYQFGLITKVVLGIILTCVIYIFLLFLVEGVSQEDIVWLKKHLSFSNILRTTTK